MRTTKTANSPWGRQVYFENTEFEIMMNELRHQAGSDSFDIGSGVDVDLVLLRNFGVDADYVPMPENTLGRTIFNPTGQIRIELSIELARKAESHKTARRRLRTTLAHEIGHVVCHRQLFLKDQKTLDMFRPNNEIVSKPNSILCRESSVGSRIYAGEWWEYQANRCMAALLLPKNMVMEYTESLLNEIELDTFEKAIIDGAAEKIMRAISARFDVSFEAVLYRLKEIGYIPGISQGQLQLVN